MLVLKKHAAFASVALVIIVVGVACSGANLRVDEIRDIKVNGRIVGTVRQVSETEQEFMYDRNGDGKIDTRWMTENSRFKTFERLDLRTGGTRTRSHYLQGTLNRIEVYWPRGDVRGIVNYPNGRDAASVELPAKKKLVEFIRN